MNIDDDFDGYDGFDGTNFEMIGDKKRESEELEALTQAFLAGGGVITVLKPWESGLANGFMTKAAFTTVTAQNEAIKKRWQKHDAQLVRIIGDLLARRENTSISRIATNSGSSAAKVRRLILEHYSENALAQAWLADGRANGNSAQARRGRAKA